MGRQKKQPVAEVAAITLPFSHPNELEDKKKFKEYLAITYGQLVDEDDISDNISIRTGGLQLNKHYDFDVYRVEPIVERMNKRDTNSPTYVSGLKFPKDKPSARTRTEWRHAKAINDQIFSKTKAETTYYILVPPKVEKTIEEPTTENDITNEQ